MASPDDYGGNGRSNLTQICLDFVVVTGVDGADKLMSVALAPGWWTQMVVEYALDFLFSFLILF